MISLKGTALANTDKRTDREMASIAGAQLAEIIALALNETNLIDRDEICAELEMLADSRRGEDERDLLSGKLIQLARSIRAGRPAKAIEA